MKRLLQKFKIAWLIFFVSLGVEAKPPFVATISSIPVDIQQKMVGHSWHQGCPVGFNQLAYLRLSYWGFDNQAHRGELIVYQPLAKETVKIFKELYAINFPIESMKLPEELPKGAKGSDLDNSSAFYCRQDGQTRSVLSKHSYGMAIDINPLYNPAIEGTKVQPEEGKKYLNRHLNHKGMIKEGDPAFLVFIHYGWKWGGYFPEVDYQHFQKLMWKHFTVTQMKYNPPDQQIPTLGDDN